MSLQITVVFPITCGLVATGCAAPLSGADVTDALALTASEAGLAWATALDGDLVFRADVPCSGAGVVTVESRWMGDDHRNDLGFAFHACSRGGVSIDGGFDATVDASVDVWSLAAEADVSLSGSLQFQGDIAGTCDLDVGAWVDLVAWDPELEWNGDVCGYDAEDTLDDAVDDLIASVSDFVLDLVLGKWW